MTPEIRLIEVQQYISRMPSFSTTVSKVMEICNSPAPSPNDLNRVISLDPVLIGVMLKLINSAYYGLPNRITSLTRAIIMLGINTVKNMVLATTVLANFKGNITVKQIPIDDFWAHCLCTGVIAKAIARLRHVPTSKIEEFFVAGLMHDLGKLPMMAAFPDLYVQALDYSAQQQEPLYLAERKVIGFDHSQVGQLIAAKWKLNIEMKYAIAGHHQVVQKEQSFNLLGTSMRLANQAAIHFRIGTGGDALQDPQLMQSLADCCDIELADLFGLQEHIEDEIEKARIFLHPS
jgi:putative nucleotidyltransferase with HDIG domain